jgi:hypothetical protein
MDEHISEHKRGGLGELPATAMNPDYFRVFLLYFLPTVLPAP